MRIRLRKGEETDLPVMASLFRNTVLSVNAADYSREETADWASCGDDPLHWVALMRSLYFVVAETIEGKSNRSVPEARNEKDRIVGFASIREDGYLHSKI